MRTGFTPHNPLNHTPVIYDPATLFNPLRPRRRISRIKRLGWAIEDGLSALANRARQQSVALQIERVIVAVAVLTVTMFTVRVIAAPLLRMFAQ